MPFDWSKVGTPPSKDEIEISVFGPGFGESIVIHLGDGRWVVVDSCIDSTDLDNKQPAALRYLRTLGVNLPDQVKLIVATHWHDDHVRGLGALVAACSSAEFCCANALLKEEFLTFVEQMSTGGAATEGAKLKDFRQAIGQLAEREKTPLWATTGRTLLAWKANEFGHGCPCNIRSLSPSDKEFSLFLAELATMMPAVGEPLRSAAARRPNTSSVVIHIDFGVTGILLGADMEVHHDSSRGWSSIVAAATTVRANTAAFVKVPHHGSVTAHYEEMWTKLLSPKPLAALTPFNRLPIDRRLPTKEDVERICKFAPESYSTTTKVSNRPISRDAAIERGLRESGIVTRNIRQSLGLVRFRGHPAQPLKSELFAPACELRLLAN